MFSLIFHIQSNTDLVIHIKQKNTANPYLVSPLLLTGFHPFVHVKCCITRSPGVLVIHLIIYKQLIYLLILLLSRNILRDIILLKLLFTMNMTTEKLQFHRHMSPHKCYSC